MQAKGLDGTIEFDGQAVTIRRDGILARGTHGTGTRTIPLRGIGSVQWRSAGLTAGSLSIVPTGRDDAPVIRAGGRGARAVIKDPNTIAFHRHKQREFEAVRDAINAALNGPAVVAPVPAPAPAPPPQGPPAGWYADPHGTAGQRWWDGTAWTDHVQ